MKVKCLLMNHWGVVHLLPCLDISIIYSTPTIIFMWLVFRMDIIFYKRLPNWFMKYIWGFLNFDFIKKREADESTE